MNICSYIIIYFFMIVKFLLALRAVFIILYSVRIFIKEIYHDQ